jgi:hypothetical protein
VALLDSEIRAKLASADALLQECVAALDGRTVPVAPASEPSARRPIAWGAKVSAVFRDRVWWICDTLKLNPDDLMACMAWESGRSFSSSKKNLAGSGATGLIQFMPTTAQELADYRNTTLSTASLAKMTSEDQLTWVYWYFRLQIDRHGQINGLSDTYMAILWPSAIGKPDDYALFTSGITYRQNAGLDENKDGKVTKAETAAKLYAMRAEGLRPENVA